jgi:hypothetical protein
MNIRAELDAVAKGNITAFAALINIQPVIMEVYKTMLFEG